MQVPGAKVALSTASCYPETCTTAFEMAADLGFDGVEVMVWTDPVSQDPDALKALSRPVRRPGARDPRAVPAAHPAGVVHGPVDQAAARPGGRRAGRRPDRRRAPAVPLAARLRPRLRRGPAPDAERDRRDVRGGEHVPVAGQEPRDRGLPARLGPARARTTRRPPSTSRTPPTSGSDAVRVVEALGDRLQHVHLADGSGSSKDEHLVPGRGGQPCGEVLERLAHGGGRAPSCSRSTPAGPSTGTSARPTSPRGWRSPGSTSRPRRAARRDRARSMTRR